ncbi:MAG: hypothetical protein EX272_10980 [Chromatiales bacterium]|nr:MAG: hypothetical protein EX272_10980 [Chromatiales bacterium]
MSSIAYFAEITPEPLLRRIVLWSGVTFALMGCLIILSLPVAVWLRLAGCGLWAVMTGRELRQLRRAWRVCRRLRFDADGDVELLEADGQWHAARLEAGSLLLQKAGWMRLQSRHGGRHGELLRGDVRSSPDWRRLQVIWRHVGA